MRNAHKILVRKERTFGRPSCGLENVDLRYALLGQCRLDSSGSEWRSMTALVNTLINLQFLQNAGVLLLLQAGRCPMELVTYTI
jgi:hypothetical protein